LVVFLFAGSLSAQTLPEPAQTLPEPAQTLPEPTRTLPVPMPPERADVDSPVPEAPESPVVSEKPLSPGIIHQLMLDEKAVYPSPLHIKKSDAKWRLPLTAATAFAFTKDQQISDQFDGHPSLQKKSLTFSQIGGPLATFGAAGGLMAIGKMTHNDH